MKEAILGSASDISVSPILKAHGDDGSTKALSELSHDVSFLIYEIREYIKLDSQDELRMAVSRGSSRSPAKAISRSLNRRMPWDASGLWGIIVHYPRRGAVDKAGRRAHARSKDR